MREELRTTSALILYMKADDIETVAGITLLRLLLLLAAPAGPAAAATMNHRAGGACTWWLLPELPEGPAATTHLLRGTAVHH
jgi:hypothetical protein